MIRARAINKTSTKISQIQLHRYYAAPLVLFPMWRRWPIGAATPALLGFAKPSGIFDPQTRQAPVNTICKGSIGTRSRPLPQAARIPWHQRDVAIRLGALSLLRAIGAAISGLRRLPDATMAFVGNTDVPWHQTRSSAASEHRVALVPCGSTATPATPGAFPRALRLLNTRGTHVRLRSIGSEF